MRFNNFFATRWKRLFSNFKKKPDLDRQLIEYVSRRLCPFVYGRVDRLINFNRKPIQTPAKKNVRNDNQQKYRCTVENAYLNFFIE